MANYPQHVNDLKHLNLQKTIYPHEVKHFPVSFKKSEDWIVRQNCVVVFPGVNFYGVLFYDNKMEGNQVDQTGAKSRKTIILLLNLFFSFTSVSLLAMSAFRHSHFPFPRHIMKAACKCVCVAVCAHTQNHTCETLNNMMV